MNENDEQFLRSYYERYSALLGARSSWGQLVEFRDLCARVRAAGGTLFFGGNGASASIASHAATDFVKQANVRAMAFNDHNLVTALSNDCGYENWLSKALSLYARPGDVAVLISSSGKSPNVVAAADYALANGMSLVSFTGFAGDNPLRSRGGVTFWVDSRAYNIVEAIHMIWVTTVVDLLIGCSEYSVQ